MFRLGFIVFVLLSLTACAGSGVKDRSAHLSEINSSEARVFVIRRTGYTNAANLAIIALNGKELGKIGNGESLSKTVSPGRNKLDVSMGGLGAIGTQKSGREFNIKAGEKRFFIVKQDVNPLYASLKLYEVSQKEFLGN